MIVHTSPNNTPPLLDVERTPKISLYQLLLLFNVDLPPQGMYLLLIVTFLRNIPPMLFPNCTHYDILLLIQVWISLFHHLVLQHICRYILNITQTIKHRKIHTFPKHARFPNLRIPNNSQQFTLLFSVECDIASSISTSSFELKKLSLSSVHLRIGRGNSSSLPQPGHIPPPISLSSFFFPPLWSSPTLQPWTLQQTPPQFFLVLLLHLHPLCNF